MDRELEVRRLLDRYLVEIVEAYGLCPWARGARLGDEVAVEVLWGSPDSDAFTASARRLLALPRTRVAMVVAPELSVTPSELHSIRDRVVTAMQTAGIADFHPDSPLDLASPARLVPYLRRSPDPLLQVVPLALLDEIRGPHQVEALARQAQLLGGFHTESRGDIGDRIAQANHERIGDAQELAARLADIAADRAATYARIGINASR